MKTLILANSGSMEAMNGYGLLKNLGSVTVDHLHSDLFSPNMFSRAASENDGTLDGCVVLADNAAAVFAARAAGVEKVVAIADKKAAKQLAADSDNPPMVHDFYEFYGKYFQQIYF